MEYDLSLIKSGVEETSGFPFELEITQRIARRRKAIYWVQPNFSFEDQDEGEARELDFHAMAPIPIGTRRQKYVFIVVLGSCKNNHNPYVFFTRKRDFPGFVECDLPMTGNPMEITTNKRIEAIDSYLDLEEIFHVARSREICSQFCEIQLQDKGWKVSSAPVYKSVVLNLIKALSNQTQGQTEEDTSPGNFSYTVYYPLLVLKGPMFAHHTDEKGKSSVREVKHVTLIHHHESKTIKCQSAIDCIHESYLDNYLTMIEKEIQLLINRLVHNQKVILASTQKNAESKSKNVKRKTGKVGEHNGST
jgi:hypothetical protein